MNTRSRSNSHTGQSGRGNNGSSAQSRVRRKTTGNSNTGPMFYFSNKRVKEACVAQKEAIEKHCDTDKEQSRAAAKTTKASNSKLGNLSDRIQRDLESIEDAIKKGYSYNRDKDNAWIEDHCRGLWLKPQGKAAQFEKFTEKLTELETELNKNMSDLLKNVGGKAADMAQQRMIELGEKALIRQGVAMTSLVVPVAGEVIVAGATIWNIVDGVWTAGKVAIESLNLGRVALAKYKELAPQLAKVEELLSGKLKPSTILAEMMTLLATKNPCIQARRCSLVPFHETEGTNTAPAGKVQAESGQGCCPGQTGHHVMPGAMFETGNNPCGKPYDHSKAPVICLEGTNNSAGSHGRAHKALEKSMDVYKAGGATTISYEEASQQAVEAVRTVNPMCSAECLKAQLDKFYKKDMKCKDNAELKPNPGKAEPKKKTSDIDAD